MEILHDICHNIYSTLMEQKFILTVLALLLAQVGSLSLSRHHDYSNTCFYYFGSMHPESNAHGLPNKASKSKNGTLKVSDFIDVDKHKRQRLPFHIQSTLRNGLKILESLQYVKPVLENNDAPQYNLTTQDLQLAFGNPSKGGLYKVPSGKVLLGLRFQLFESQTPSIGEWNFVYGLVNDDQNLKQSLKDLLSQLRNNLKDLTSLQVVSSLNLIPQQNQRSIFKYFKDQPPATGTLGSITYISMMVVIRAGQEILAGSIENSQMVQFKENVKDRSYCD